MKKIIFLIFISTIGYSQNTITITDYKTKLLNTYSLDKVVDNQFQESYKVTNIYNLSTQQVDIIKINKTYNINIYETNKSYKKESEFISPYSKVQSGFRSDKRKYANLSTMSLSIKCVIRNISTGQYYNGVNFTTGYKFAKHFISEEVARTFIGRDSMKKGHYIVEKVYIKE